MLRQSTRFRQLACKITFLVVPALFLVCTPVRAPFFTPLRPNRAKDGDSDPGLILHERTQQISMRCMPRVEAAMEYDNRTGTYTCIMIHIGPHSSKPRGASINETTSAFLSRRSLECRLLVRVAVTLAYRMIAIDAFLSHFTYLTVSRLGTGAPRRAGAGSGVSIDPSMLLPRLWKWVQLEPR